MSRSKILLIATTILILISIPIALILVRQRQELRKQAVWDQYNRLVCDSGTSSTSPPYDPYNSNTITVTNNHSSAINNVMVSNVFRCPYEPGKVVTGFYSCETLENCQKKWADGNPHCQVGVWDQQASVIHFSMQQGESRTFTVTANNCEIVQLDVYNENAPPLDDPTECFNPRSVNTNPLPPNPWPGGIAFAISQNSTGYIAGVGCPTPTPTPTRTPTPTTTPTRTPTPTTTPPVGGQPSNTPTPTRTPTPTPTRTPTPSPTRSPTPTPSRTPTPRPINTPIPTSPPGSPPTNTPVPPVSGNIDPTVITLIGGGILILIGLLL